MKHGIGTLCVVFCLALAVMPLTAAAETPEEKAERLEKEIAELRAMVDQLTSESPSDETLAEIQRQIAILAEEVENLKVGEAVVEATSEGARPGLGPAASKVYGKESGFSIGGYGEMLLQAYDSKKDDGTDSGKQTEFDFLRAVFYFGYKFSDSFVFNSEIEVEHASTSQSGSVSVEFAYVDYLYRDALNFRVGLLLLPMGLLNELHEPTVFLGAVRPETERRIIPSTWRENGLGIHGDIGGFTYRTYIVNGLDASGFSAAGLRGGRQKGSKAEAEDFAWVGRFDYVATPGLMVGGSIYAGGSGQGLDSPDGGALSVPTTIYEGHVDYRFKGWQLRGLYARSDVGDVAELNEALGLVGNQSVGESLVGYYAEAGYDLFSRRSGRSALIPYLRWEKINTQHSVPDGWQSNPATDDEILSLGIAYQPIEQLIAKLEYQNVDNGAGTGVDRINLNFGYIF